MQGVCPARADLRCLRCRPASAVPAPTAARGELPRCQQNFKNLTLKKGSSKGLSSCWKKGSSFTSATAEAAGGRKGLTGRFSRFQNLHIEGGGAPHICSSSTSAGGGVWRKEWEVSSSAGLHALSASTGLCAVPALACSASQCSPHLREYPRPSWAAHIPPRSRPRPNPHASCPAAWPRRASPWNVLKWGESERGCPQKNETWNEGQTQMRAVLEVNILGANPFRSGAWPWRSSP